MLGIDDFAYRKGIDYGTILIDMDTSMSIDVLTVRKGKRAEKVAIKISGCKNGSQRQWGEIVKMSHLGRIKVSIAKLLQSLHIFRTFSLVSGVQIGCLKDTFL